MISTAEAAEAIAAALPRFEADDISLAHAAGRILLEPVCAERDQPPFDRVTMDGIALRYDAFAAGERSFSIAATGHAGDPVIPLASDGECVEIMTGAVLPVTADCVVPVERITISDNVATIEAGYKPERNQFIHAQGSDHASGFEVLSAGVQIEPADIAIIASCGRESVRAAALPAVSVISTGNELVAPGDAIEDHQIRLSNGPALVAMLAAQGFTDAAHDHIVDEPELLRQRIGGHLDNADVLILSGGVSMGKADFVPQVLAELGVSIVFHKISQRPGKPMWFGTGPAGQLVFALPGNPVSTLVCCRQYVLPALYAASGRLPRQPETAVLDEAVTFKPRLTCFLPVILDNSHEGVVKATPVTTNTSGDFSALHGTGGYVELDCERDEFAAGTIVPLHRWEQP